MTEKHNRRAFVKELLTRAAKWSPLLSMLSLRLHQYANPAAVGWQGWVTWCGRLVGFVRLNGSFFSFP